jgi:hypothetical protein
MYKTELHCLVFSSFGELETDVQYYLSQITGTLVSHNLVVHPDKVYNDTIYLLTIITHITK